MQLEDIPHLKRGFRGLESLRSHHGRIAKTEKRLPAKQIIGGSIPPPTSKFRPDPDKSIRLIPEETGSQHFSPYGGIAYALALEASVFGHGGSSPSTGTIYADVKGIGIPDWLKPSRLSVRSRPSAPSLNPGAPPSNEVVNEGADTLDETPSLQSLESQRLRLAAWFAKPMGLYTDWESCSRLSARSPGRF
jgi:hypothetical protein